MRLSLIGDSRIFYTSLGNVHKGFSETTGIFSNSYKELSQIGRCLLQIAVEPEC